MEHHRHDHSPVTRDHHSDEPSAGDLVGEAAGGISGVLAGAALGSLGGPIGTIIGGIAGATGGWWAGRSISEAAAHYTEDDDSHYRAHYESQTDRPANLTYDRARTGYAVGHIAGRNPDYGGRRFEEVEPDIERGWSAEHGGDWNVMRDYARHGYERSASSPVTDSNR
ncbi:hypothetical protein BH20GEM2_BH20GEM2_01490 [soil metagenome]|jgi:hypothetical protein